MTKYRVYGDKTHKYYIDVAWNLALEMNSIWHDVETDDPIDPYSVEEIQLNKDN
jgi:hypothetical protein